MAGPKEFQWPWQYNFPPFFTLQPNEETRKKQQNAWCQLVLDYFKHHNKVNISVTSLSDASDPLFHNKSIQRSAKPELIESVLHELYLRQNLEWTDKYVTYISILVFIDICWSTMYFLWYSARSIFTKFLVCYGL